MNAKNLLDEVAELRLLVDSLCAAVLEPQKDEAHEKMRQIRASKAKYRGMNHVRELIAMEEFRELEYRRQVLIEDYPNIQEMVK
jgi:hypothetical protein